jgi:predicted MFS family arabinose efflux permease
MNTRSLTADQLASSGTQANPDALSKALVFLLACGAGLGAASLYYNQPILGTLAAEFHASPAEIGRVPTLTQVGYAIGILLLAPIGDRFDRRTIILCKAAVLSLALLATAAAQSLFQLCALSVVIGVAASLAQDCVPAAAALAPEARRGKIVGSVMTGLLLGILLSRVVSGTVSEMFGWRAMFVLAAAAIAALAMVSARYLPRFAPTTDLPYSALLGSLATLWRRHGALRRAALAQGLLSAAFSAFWSTLAVMLHQPPFGFGSSVAGAFGLAGAVGALAAPIAGGIADRKGPELVTRIGAMLVLVSFVGFALAPGNLWLLVAGTLLFDLGVQAALIAHQSIIYRLEPAARSRLTAILVGAMFVGMAGGSALGSVVLSLAGWRGLSLLAAAAALAALGVRFWPGVRTVPVAR